MKDLGPSSYLRGRLPSLESVTALALGLHEMHQPSCAKELKREEKRYHNERSVNETKLPGFQDRCP